MAKKKKLSDCEEKAIVALEAKRIREKEKKQRARDKRKRENETEGPNKRAVLGGQVLPYQAGINPSVPEQTYASYVTPREAPSFLDRVTSVAVSQAPAALQAYLFMNQGRPFRKSKKPTLRNLVTQLISDQTVKKRDKSVQAGGNRVGGGDRRNLIRAPQFQPVLEEIEARGQVPPIRSRPEPDLVDRAIAGVERGFGRVGRGIKKGGLGVKRVVGGLLSGAGSALGNLGNFAGRVYDDALKTGRELRKFNLQLEDDERQSLLKKNEEDIELDDFKQNENELRNRKKSLNRNQPPIADDEKIDEYISPEEQAEMDKNERELKEREAKRIAALERIKAAAAGSNNEKPGTIEMQNVSSENVEPLISKRQQVLNSIIKEPSVGRYHYNNDLTVRNLRLVESTQEQLMSVKTSGFGVNSRGYVVDRVVGRYLHPDYKKFGIDPPSGYFHFDEKSVNQARNQNRNPDVVGANVFNDSLLNMSMGLTPVKKEQENTGQSNQSNSFTEANQYDFDNDYNNLIPNQAVNESNLKYDNSNLNQSREDPWYSSFEPFEVSNNASEFNVSSSNANEFVAE